MYRDSFTEPGWMRILRWFSASFRLGRFFRVEVRIFWIALVLMPLILMRDVRMLPFAQGATWIALILVSLYLIIWTHEMGHIVAGRRYHIQTPLITLGPMGGLAHMSSGAPDPNKDIVISLAGPAVHLIWIALLFPLTLLFDYGDLAPGGWRFDPFVGLFEVLLQLNFWLMLFNLLPCFPMDGGRVFRAVLAKRMHPNKATMIATKVGTIGAIVFIVVGIVMWVTPPEDFWGIILIMIGISNLMACKQERLAAQYTAGPYMTADPRQPWQADPDAWRHAAEDAAEDAAEASAKAEKRATKDAKRRARDEEADRALDVEVDRVLDRLNEVGLEGLTAKERKTLDKASKRRRGG